MPAVVISVGSGYHCHASFLEGLDDVLASRARVAARHDDVGAGVGEHGRQEGGLGLEVDNDSYGEAVEGAIAETFGTKPSRTGERRRTQSICAVPADAGVGPGSEGDIALMLIV